MITIIFILRQENTRRAGMSAIATRSNPDPIVTASASRTPVGRFTGALAGMPANGLGAAAIRAALAQAGVDGKDVSEVLMGCVLPAGQGQAPARKAARKAGQIGRAHV